MKRVLLMTLFALVVLFGAGPRAQPDAAKSEIRAAIDAAYLNAFWNGMDIKAFLAGWDQGAISPMLAPTGELSYVTVMDWISGAVRANRKPPEKKEYKFLYPAIDVTGNMGMAQVEVMRGETLMYTDYFPVVKTRTGWKIVGYPFYFHQNGARPETPAGEADAVKKVVEDTLVRGLMQEGTTEQVLAGIASVCDINLYLPELDVVTRLALATPLAVKSHGMKPLPIKTSAFTLIGITGDVAAAKLAVTFDAGPVMTMYVALYKLKTGWAIVQIVTDQPFMSMFPPPPPPPQRLP